MLAARRLLRTNVSTYGGSITDISRLTQGEEVTRVVNRVLINSKLIDCLR